MIERKKYLNELINSMNNGFPKVITGIRRCGKSYMLKNIFSRYLISNGVLQENILFIDLDNDENAELRDPLYLGEHVRKYSNGKEKVYVFVDEIQKVFTIVNPVLTDGKHVLATAKDKEVISFVDVVLGLSREENIDLYITGSNSKMLSSDIITEFRDKATNIHINPLSFEEFYNYRGGYKIEAFYEFLQFGGMPLCVLKKTEEEKKNYLASLFKTTYFKDILEHNNLHKSESLDELCNIISELTGETINAEKIANTYASIKHEKIDKQTVDKYIQYFEDAFVIREAKRYDIKGRNEIGALRKYYFVDSGLRNARLNFSFQDEGHMLETVVYNELMYEGYSVNVGVVECVEQDKNRNSIRKTYEIDFYAKKANKLYYIQVVNDILDLKTKDREIKPFLKLKDNVQKIIVINKPISETRDENGFTVIGVVDFLLKFIK